jgi:D-alanyl-D-alanine carboxypeptidase
VLRKILIILGILIGLVIILGAVGIYYFQPKKELVLNFIKENPEKSAITLVRNDTVLASLNADRMMPLASTVKIIIAIEYAEQAAQGKINPDEKISLSELNPYYVANTDGGAHPAWLQSIQSKTEDQGVTIREIAEGMIRYSSNANTEWLSQKLGLQNINNRMDSLGIKQHSKIYYIVSALFVGKERFPDLKGKALADALKGLSMEEYISTTDQIHSKLQADTSYKKDLGDLSMKIQRIWSDRLPASTTAEYAQLMKKINSRTHFSEKTQLYLDEVMEYLLDNPANRQWLEHAGMKGGSTAFVLTKALYATDKKGNKTELAYFFNDLSLLQSTRLEMSMNEFELNILTNAAFREQVQAELGD